MFNLLLGLTAAICVLGPLLAYLRFKDVFHPLMLIMPMSAFMYVYMPFKLIQRGELWTYVTEEQAIFMQLVVVLAMTALTAGSLTGSAQRASDKIPLVRADRHTLHMGAYIVGGIGLAAWLFTLRESGGLSGAFGSAYGGTWSDYGYLRDASYLVIVGVLLLISPEGIDVKNKFWWCAVAAFSFPWGVQALLGARRGPTFMMVVCIGMSWFLARAKRPSILIMVLSGAGLGLFMLFLVTNRDSICLNCDLSNLKTDVSDVVMDANETNEYIFGVGCITTSRVTGKCYWGKRYAAQVLVRPVPRQIWPGKYTDTGLEDLEQNAGVAGADMQSVMGWSPIKGAAAGMIADLWVEFSWLEIPVCWIIGWSISRIWRRAVQEQSFWTTEYVILCILSIYMVTQSGEAVIFRLVIMSVPALLVWRFANKAGEENGNLRILEPLPATSVHA